MPAVVAHTGVIGDAVNASTIITLVVYTLVNVKGTVVLGVTGRALAHVTISRVEAVAPILAIHVKTQPTADIVTMGAIVVLL